VYRRMLIQHRYYTAAMIETDGSLSATMKTYKYKRLDFEVVTNTSARLVWRVYNILTRYGYHPSFVKSLPNMTKPIYRVSLNRMKDMYALLREVYHHLIVKRSVAKAMMKFLRSRLSHSYACYPYTDNDIKLMRQITVEIKKI